MAFSTAISASACAGNYFRSYQKAHPDWVFVFPDPGANLEQTVASGLIYLNSHANDFKNPEVRPYLDRYLRGSNGYKAEERVKLMKLLWDSISTEFGGRHELYEMNYAGNHEDIRIQAMWNARMTGTLDGMIALADQCLSDYDEDGWCNAAWLDPDDVAYVGGPSVTRAAE